MAKHPHSILSQVLSLCFLILSGCRQSEEQQPALELLGEVSRMESRLETGLVDLTSTSTGASLVRGFSPPITGGRRSLTFVRSRGRESIVRFELLEPREIVLTLRGRSVPRGTTGEVAIGVNEKPLATIELGPKLHRRRIPIPRGLLREGENRLRLAYSPETQAVSWYEIRFGKRLPTQRNVRLAGSGKAVFVPFGTELRLAFFAPRRASFRASSIEVRGDGRWQIRVRREGADDITLREGTSARDVELVFDNEAAAPVEIGLAAVADSAAGERDGLLVTAPAIWTARQLDSEAAGGSPSVPRRPNVVVYLVDTLRADHLGCYGYERPEGPVSPRIDAFASSATLFESALAQTSWTRPAVASIFTGMWPAAHGVNGKRDKLSSEATTLAEILSAAGYETAAFVYNPNAWGRFGLRQGFDRYGNERRGYPPSSRRLNDLVFEWLDERDTGRPFFLYLHTIDPHYPYNPPEVFRKRFAPNVADPKRLSRRESWSETDIPNLIDLYDGEIAYNDESFGQLIDDLERRRLWDDTLILFVSDHGEEFQEHGAWTHGRQLYAESVEIPLIIKWPGQAVGERRSDLAQHIDLPSTILAAAGLPQPASFEGRNLAELADPAEVTALMYLEYNGPLMLAAQRDSWKLIAHSEERTTRLFDLAEDPSETADRSRDNALRSAAFDHLLASSLQPAMHWLSAGEAEIDPELREKLRALGYVD
jgi:arylsulfatase A-like enzyme